MKKICFLFFALLSIAATAQQIAPDARASIVKAAVMNAFGGSKALKKISHFSYTIHKTTYNSDTTVTRTAYTLDLHRKYIQEKQFTTTDTITKWIGQDGAWQQKHTNKTALPEPDKLRLQRVFLTNFIPMLQNDSLVYEYKKPIVYKGREAEIVQVYTPQKKALIMDLFVDAKTGKILTSSKPDPETGNYSYYADELDYQPIGEGVIFPLVYQVWVKGRLVTEGKFTNVEVKRGKRKTRRQPRV